MFEKLVNFNSINNNKNLKKILIQFRTNKNIRNIHKKVLNIILGTTLGKVMKGFSKWKELP